MLKDRDASNGSIHTSIGEAEIKRLDFLTSQEILHRSKTGGFIAKEIKLVNEIMIHIRFNSKWIE